MFVVRDFENLTTDAHLFGKLSTWVENTNGGPIHFNELCGRGDTVVPKIFTILDVTS